MSLKFRVRSRLKEINVRVISVWTIFTKRSLDMIMEAVSTDRKRTYSFLGYFSISLSAIWDESAKETSGKPGGWGTLIPPKRKRFEEEGDLLYQIDILRDVLTENCEVLLGHWQLKMVLFEQLPHITPCSLLYPSKPVLYLRLWPHALDWGSKEVFRIPESYGNTSTKLELSLSKKIHCDLAII